MDDNRKNIVDTKDRERTRNEKMASYFYDLSKLSFAGLVVGGMIPITSGTADLLSTVLLTAIGTALSMASAYLANEILKRKI